MKITCRAMCWYEDKQGHVTTTTNITHKYFNHSLTNVPVVPQIEECPSAPWQWKVGWEMMFPQISLPGEKAYQKYITDNYPLDSYAKKMKARALAKPMQDDCSAIAINTQSQNHTKAEYNNNNACPLYKKRILTVHVKDQAGNQNIIRKSWIQQPGLLPPPLPPPSYQNLISANPSSPNPMTMQIHKLNEYDVMLQWESPSDPRVNSYGVPLQCLPILQNPFDPTSGHPDDYGDRCLKLREQYRSTHYLVWWTASNDPQASTVMEKVGKPAEMDLYRGDPVYMLYALKKAQEYMSTGRHDIWYMENVTCPRYAKNNGTVQVIENSKYLKCINEIQRQIGSLEIPIVSSLVPTKLEEKGKYSPEIVKERSQRRRMTATTTKDWVWNDNKNGWMDANTEQPIRKTPLTLIVNRTKLNIQNSNKNKNSKVEYQQKLVDTKLKFGVVLVPKVWMSDIAVCLPDSLDRDCTSIPQYQNTSMKKEHPNPTIPIAAIHQNVWTTTYDCEQMSIGNNEGSYLHRRSYQYCTSDCERGEMKRCAMDSDECYSTQQLCPIQYCPSETGDDYCNCQNQYSTPTDPHSFGRVVMRKNVEDSDNQKRSNSEQSMLLSSKYMCNMSNTTSWDGNHEELSMYHPLMLDETQRSTAKTKVWYCKSCPIGASCVGTRTGDQVGVRFGYWRAYWNSSLMLACDIPEACLGEPDPTYAWYRETKGDYGTKDDVMYFRVPRTDDAKRDSVNGVPFCSTEIGVFPKEYNCSNYRYGVNWLDDDDIGNSSLTRTTTDSYAYSYVDLALRENTGTRCNSEAGYAERCSSLIEPKNLDVHGKLLDPNRTVQCRRCTRCLQNGTNQRYGRGNWIRNDCVKCPVRSSSDAINPSLISLMFLVAGFICMSWWTLSQNTSNHRVANFFVMQKAKSKLMAKMLAKRRAKNAQNAPNGDGKTSSSSPFSSFGSMKNKNMTKIAPTTASSSEIVTTTSTKSKKKKRLSRIEKIKDKKKRLEDKEKQLKHDSSMGSKNEDATIGSISMTKILMNHIHMMSMIPLFDSNFLTNLNKAFFNAVGSIFGLYTGSAFECYFDYKEMLPLAAQRGVFFMLSPFVVISIVGLLWLPQHFCQDHTKKYYGSFLTKIIALFVTVLDMLYPVLTLETLKMLPCTTVYDDTTNPCDSRKFMMIDLDIECGRDVRHGTMLAIAMPMLWIYVLGIPAFALLQILWHRKDLNDKKTHIRLNAILAGFKLDKKWWSVVVMLRKALFITAAIMFKDFGPFIQIFSGAFVVCIFAYLHFVNAPYVEVFTGVDEITCEYVNKHKSDILHQMEGGSLMIELITLFCMLVMTDKRAGEIHILKVWLGIFMFVMNFFHLTKLMQMTLFRSHREMKLGKTLSTALTKSMVARRVVTNAIDDAVETVSTAIESVVANATDVVTGRSAKRKREQKRKMEEQKRKDLTKVAPIKAEKEEKIDDSWLDESNDSKKNVETTLSHLTLSELRRVYRHFDANNDSMIDAKEVRGMMEHATKTYSGINLSKETIAMDSNFFVQILDTDGDGVISENEFIHFMESYKSFNEEQRQNFAEKSPQHLRIGTFTQKMIVVAREKYGVESNEKTLIMNADTASLMLELAKKDSETDLEDVTKEQVTRIMNNYLSNCFPVPTDLNDDMMRGDRVLADLAESLSSFDGEYASFINAVQNKIGLLSPQAYDEKRMLLERRRRQTKEKLDRQSSTIFGYDQNKQKEEVERQQRAAEAMAEVERMKREALEREEEEKREQEKIQQELKEKKEKELSEGKAQIDAMLKMENITGMSIFLF